MKDGLEYVVQVAKEAAVRISKARSDIIINEHGYEEKFINECGKMIDHIKSRYMKDDVEWLDRHKLVACIMVNLVNAQILELVDELPDDKKFMGNELLAVEVGISFLVDMINQNLEQHGIDVKIEDINWPTPFSCDTTEDLVLARNLYYAKNEWGLNPLDLSEKLYLLEYITLIQCDVDINKLKVKKECTE